MQIIKNTEDKTMKASKRLHKIIAVFLTLNFLTTLLPINVLFANSNGPKAPEAASFEPIDATDMVNLMTGDFNYVLPLLNVPSPEGGYPLALAYHAGIAMDQEASWVGLGWNLNPGAINRSINGYADDYNASLLTEYFYDEGSTESIYSLSASVSSLNGSVGLNFSWGSNQSLSGAVSVGYGPAPNSFGPSANISFGSNGVGIGAGYSYPGGLSLGVNANSNGGVGANLGINSNGLGFDMGYSTERGMTSGFKMSILGSESNPNSLNVSLSSSGVGFTYGSRGFQNTMIGGQVATGGGIGLNISFSNSEKMGEYTTTSSGWMIPIIIPLGPFIVDLGFGKQKFKYSVEEKSKNYVTGPLYYFKNNRSQGKWRIVETEIVTTFEDICYGLDEDGDQNCDYDVRVEREVKRNRYFLDLTEAQNYKNACGGDCGEIIQVENDEAFLDMYEFSSDGITIKDNTDVSENNLAFPSYDNFNVQAQGLSGNISAKLFENGALYGISNKENSHNERLNYVFDGDSDLNNISDHQKFNSTGYFQFSNEINTYLRVTAADFKSVNNNIVSPDQLYNDGANEFALNRRRTSNHIVHYTNGEVIDAYQNGGAIGDIYLGPSLQELDRTQFPEEGIGGFQITAPDGKTYHYALPVYNHETVTRTFGVVKNNDGTGKSESESYLEKRQLEPYATHWLLTAVTGPDYMDDGDNIPDEGDLGYWVNFEYGKWSDAFVWKSPYGKPYFEPEGLTNNKTKTWIRGRKELYYLDAVKTRTHTAIFVKSQRTDARSPEWVYRSVAHDESRQSASDYVERFTIPAQNQLQLDKIVLLKNEDALGLAKNTASIPPAMVTIEYNDAEKPAQNAGYNLGDNIYDTGDGIMENSAIKVIDFSYDPANRLKSGQSSLTLDGVYFKGKSGSQVLPPYKFAYNDRLFSGDVFYTFNIEDKDGWGYHKDDNSLWSLNGITTPQGGKISIQYTNKKFLPVLQSAVKFNLGPEVDDNLHIGEVDNLSLETFTIETEIDYDISVGAQDLDIVYTIVDCDGIQETTEIYRGTGVIVQDLSTNDTYKYLVQGTGTWSGGSNPSNCGDGQFVGYEDLDIVYTLGNVMEQGGVATSSITVSDDLKSYRTEYAYGENEDGVGYASYLPFAPELQRELPYAQELPSPRVMYEYVTMRSYSSQQPNQTDGKTVYKFNIMKEKDPNKIKFGEFFEIDESIQATNNFPKTYSTNNSTASFTLKDNLAAIGQLLEVSNYNSEGHLLNKMTNHYYAPDEVPNDLGKTEESYQTYKEVIFNDGTGKMNIANSSTRITYPSLAKGTTEYRDGFVYETDYATIDNVVGQATEILTRNSKGDAIRVKTMPAYINYPEMGSKLDNVENKNMLTQEAMTIAERYMEGEWKKQGVGVTTWKPFAQLINTIIDLGPITIDYTNAQNIWRKHKTFIWNGDTDTDGFFLNYIGDDDGFDWSSPDAVQPSQWRQQSEITQYNKYSTPLEIKDINNNYAATKIGYGDTRTIAVCNAGYGESFYSGAEDEDGQGNYGGEVTKGTAQDSPDVHTGLNALAIAAGQNAYNVTVNHDGPADKRFKISLWAKKGTHQNTKVNIGGNEIAHNTYEEVFAGDWVQLNFYTAIAPGTQVHIMANGGSTIVDDFRLHPVVSSMSSYVYNEWDELSHILGANNMAVHYEYDIAGRLVRTSSEAADFNGEGTGGFKKTGEHKYTYKIPTN